MSEQIYKFKVKIKRVPAPPKKFQLYESVKVTDEYSPHLGRIGFIKGFEWATSCQEWLYRIDLNREFDVCWGDELEKCNG